MVVCLRGVRFFGFRVEVFLGFKVQGFGFRGSGLNEGAGFQNVHVQFMAWDEVGLWEVEHT